MPAIIPTVNAAESRCADSESVADQEDFGHLNRFADQHQNGREYHDGPDDGIGTEEQDPRHGTDSATSRRRPATSPYQSSGRGEHGERPRIEQQRHRGPAGQQTAHGRPGEDCGQLAAFLQPDSHCQATVWHQCGHERRQRRSPDRRTSRVQCDQQEDDQRLLDEGERPTPE